MLLRSPFAFTVLAAFATGSTVPVHAWDYQGHRIVNQVALTSLPPEFPSFTRTPQAAERIAFLAGEPDRWRNVADLPIKQLNGLDHYCDIEQLADAGLEASRTCSLRYEFTLAFAAGRAAHAEKFPSIDPAKNADHAREWPGFAPWAVTEYYGKLKSAFSYLRAYEQYGGTPDEIANAQANVVYVMGVMGHIVGDLAQPLHTTKHHHGWVGENPQGYSTASGIHAWIDGGLMTAIGLTVDDVRAQARNARLLDTAPREDGRDPVFAQVMAYLLAQNRRVEVLYALEKTGKLGPEAPDPVAARDFLSEQIRAGGEMLANLWLTAWQNAGEDAYLRGELEKRPPPPAPTT